MPITTFEEVDQHLASIDLDRKLSLTGPLAIRKNEARTDPAQVVGKVCAIYQVVSPVLRLVARVPIIPLKWRDAIRKFCDMMDLLCAGTGGGL